MIKMDKSNKKKGISGVEEKYGDRERKRNG